MAEGNQWKSRYDVLRYNIVPPLFVVVFTFAGQLLLWMGNSSEDFTIDRLVAPLH